MRQVQIIRIKVPKLYANISLGIHHKELYLHCFLGRKFLDFIGINNMNDNLLNILIK